MRKRGFLLCDKLERIGIDREAQWTREIFTIWKDGRPLDDKIKYKVWIDFHMVGCYAALRSLKGKGEDHMLE